jgi:hypothetical protein
MRSIRWTTALLLCVGLFGGCQPNKHPAPEPDAVPAPDVVAAAKARLEAQGMVVGTVDAVADSKARVSGIDQKSVSPTDVLSFIDPQSDRVVNNGTLRMTTDAGAIVVEAGPYGERAPRVGDLVVKLK